MIAVYAVLLALITPAQQLGPTLPTRCTPELHKLNAEVQRLLSESKFSEAEKALRGWPYGEVAYELVGALPAYAEGADAEAAQLWSEAADGRVRFVARKEGIVRIELVKSALLVDPLPEWKSGRLLARVALTVGKNDHPVPQRSISKAVAKAFGIALGHAHLQNRLTVMGIDLRVDNPPQGSGLLLDASELRVLEGILTAREALAKAVSERRSIIAAVPMLVVEPTSADGGMVTRGKRARFVFSLANKGNSALDLQTETTCGCILLNPPGSLSAGEKTTLEAELDTRDFTGPIEKRILFYSNDPAAPFRDVVLKAVSLPEYRVLPDSMQIVNLNDEGPTHFDVIVYNTPGNPVRLLNAQTNKPTVTTDIQPWTGEVVDPLFGEKPQRRLGYQVRVTFSPEYQSGIDWARIILITDSKTQPWHEVALQTYKGIAAQPKTVWFGVLPSGKRERRTVTLAHASKRFEILDLKVEGAPCSATWEKEGDEGRKYRIVVECTPEKAGTFSGQVTVRTNSALYPTVAIPVSGSVK